MGPCGDTQSAELLLKSVKHGLELRPHGCGMKLHVLIHGVYIGEHSRMAKLIELIGTYGLITHSFLYCGDI